MTACLRLIGCSLFLGLVACAHSNTDPRLGATESPSPPPRQIHFHPSSGAEILERFSFHRTDGTSEQRVEGTLNSRFDLSVESGGGWTLTQKVTRLKTQKQNPQGPEGQWIDKGAGRLAELGLVAHLAPDGTFVSVAGGRDLNDGSRDQWTSRFQQLFDRPLVIGTVIETHEKLSLTDNQAMTYLLARRVESFRVVPSGEQLVLSLHCRAEGKTNSAVDCQGEQVIDLEPFRPERYRLSLTRGDFHFNEDVSLLPLHR